MYQARMRILAVMLTAFAIAACERPAPPDAVDAPLEIKVMTFNIEWGGTNISFDNVIEAIRLSGADIVGVQEAQGNLERLGSELGWYYDRRNHVVSRFPLLDPPGGDGKYLLVEVTPGHAVALANLHLPSDPYGPDMVRDRAALEAVLENERVARLPTLHSILHKLPPVLEAGYPVFVTGDFNSPSHADWTAAMVGERPFLNYAVDWPVSRAMVDAGFEDAWRAVYPDARTKPGLTWWAGRPPLEDYAPGEGDPQDRIDMIWFAGAAEPVAARLIGETDGPGVDTGVMPWPSDHRAVIATFAVEAQPLHDLLTTDRRVYLEDQAVRVIGRFAAPDTEVVIRNVSRDASVASLSVASLAEPLHLPVGHYLATASTGVATYEREFWIASADAIPAVASLGAVFEPHEPIGVEWHAAPGNRFDYIGLYAAGDDDVVDGLLAFAYTDSRPEGRAELATPAAPATRPLVPGSYILRLMKDDGYEVLAESEVFEIR